MEGIGYKFKKYIPRNKTFEFPAITIMETCMRMNRLCKKFIWKKPYCEIFYDENEKVIAIKPTHIETFCTLRIIERGEDHNTTIQCKAFIRENGIFRYLNLAYLGKKSIQLPAQWDDKNKCFFVNLKYFKEKLYAKQS